MRTNLEGINRVIFYDFSGYDSEKSNNGGCYGFWTQYDRTAENFEVSCHTTSDFVYCPCCGSFNDHYASEEDDIYGSGYTCGQFEIVTEPELLKMINNFEETEDRYIEYK